MNNEELNALYVDILETLRNTAPWTAEQVEQTVREGKPVARQVSRSKGGNETVALVVASAKLRDDQFAATEELTASERTMVALNAIERLLVDPPAIDEAMRETMSQVKVDTVLFAEPSAEGVESIRASALIFAERDRLAELLARVKGAVHSGR